MEDLITKEAAKLLGLKYYFTGIPCKKGHIEKRYINTGICYQCKRDQHKRNYEKHSEVVKVRNSRSSIKNRIRRNRYSKEWSKKNHSKRLEIMMNYRVRNKEKINFYGRQYMKRKRLNPYYRVSKNISKAIWESLKERGRVKDRKWINLVNFSVEELIVHLESKFRDGMTWENYGSIWHLDHIKPLSSFSEENIMEAWELSNLQPLLKFENLSKGSKIISSFESN